MVLSKESDELQLSLAERVLVHPNLGITPGQELRKHYERTCDPGAQIERYFCSIRKDVLIDIDPKGHRIELSFSIKPDRHSRRIFKELCCQSGWLLRDQNPTEFTFGFAKVCDLRAIAWAVAIEYRKLGYRCRICREGEVIDVAEILAKAEPSPLWRQIEEVPPCA